MELHSIAIVLILCLTNIRIVYTENRSNHSDCDIQKMQQTGPITLKFINDQAIYLGNFSISNEIICKTGQFAMKLIDRSNIEYGKLNSTFIPNELRISYRQVTSHELSLLTLPFNLNHINASHNVIQHISYGMCNTTKKKCQHFCAMK